MVLDIKDFENYEKFLVIYVVVKLSSLGVQEWNATR